MNSVEGSYLKFFSGFSLHNEATLFADFIPPYDTVAAGFSYGAQQALEYALQSEKRIDRLILLSPAFFQTQKPSFIRAQLRYFDTDKENYIRRFLENVAYPCAYDLSSFLKEGSKEELEALLRYRWSLEKIDKLKAKGVTVEVFLGDQDKIIDANAAYDFFRTHTVVYTLKGCGHLLKGST